MIGARLYLDDLEDTRIAEGDPTITVIHRVIAEVQPTIVYAHSLNDVHQDHRNVHRAAMVACRRVGRVYCFQSPSATVDYRPTHFVTVDDYIERKLKAIDAFGSQTGVRDYLEPGLIISTARYWSRYGGGSHAEPFEAIRDRAGSQAGDVVTAPLRVLVTGAGGPAAIAAMKSLRAEESVQLIAADMDPWAAGLYLTGRADAGAGRRRRRGSPPCCWTGAAPSGWTWCCPRWTPSCSRWPAPGRNSPRPASPCCSPPPPRSTSSWTS